MSDPITGYQLIFTNVEADCSPSRQRGFQVWLASPELSADQRRAVAKRVEEFRLPPGVPPANPLARHAFFRIPEGLFVVARTVPLAERDKFGRGGKFHAHAVILKEEEFRRLGSDPFAVIDGGFPFHSHPDEATARVDWRTGHLPPAVIDCRETVNEIVTLPPERLIELFAHVERGDERPVAVADKPDRVLAVLRTCFRVFPEYVRRRLEFDTLSNGTFLSQLKYPVVGAYSADFLKGWAFRRYVRLDPEPGTFSPKLGSPPAFPASLITAAGWAELGGEREAVYGEARALSEGRIDDLHPERLTPAAAELLGSCPGFREALATAVQARVERDLPAALAALPAVAFASGRHFDTFPGEVLNRLTRPIPRTVVGAALVEAFGQSPEEPAPEALAALGEWHAAGDDPRLGLVFCRWHGTPHDVAVLEAFLARPDTAAQRWFRDWLPTSFPPELRRPDAATWLKAKLGADRIVHPATLRDARLWLAADSATDVELRLLIAYHQGTTSLAPLLAGSGKLAGADDWLARTAAVRFGLRFAPGWMSDGLGGSFLGLFVVPGDRAGERLLDVCSGCGGRGFPLRLLRSLWPGITAKAGGTLPDTEPNPPEGAKRRYAAVLGAEPRELTAAVSSLREHLTTADDTAFRWTANLLLQMAAGEPVLQPVTEEVTLLGVKLGWVQYGKPGAFTGLFEAIAGAAVPEVSPGSVPDVGRRLETRAERRFTWLLTRLLDPIGTGKLPL